MTGPLAMGAQKITTSYNPQDGEDLTNKAYVDAGLNEKLSLSGGTMTGNILMGGNKVVSSAAPVSGDDLTNKAYVDAGLNEKLSLSGGTMTGNILMGGNKVVSSAAPVSGDDLTNKDYVDTAIGTQHTADTEQFVDVSGDTMTGALDMGANKVTSSYTPTDDNDLTNKTFVDTELSKQKSELEGEIAQAIENVTNGTTPISGVVKTDGSTPLTATWNAGQKITGIPAPTENSDVANKKYVDDAVSGVQVEGVVKTDGSTPLTATWNAGQKITGIPTPTENSDVANKEYVDAHAGGGGDVTAAGDNTFTGTNTFNNPVTVGTPTADAHAATKAYVDSRPGGGGDVTQAGNNTFTGNNTFNNPVTVGAPTADAHAATKKYADDLNTTMGTRVSGLETEFDGLAAEIEGIDPAGLLKADGSVPLTGNWDVGNNIINVGETTNNRLACSPGRVSIMKGGRIKLLIDASTNYSYITLFNGSNNVYLTAINGEIGFSLSNNLSNPIPIIVGTPTESNHASTKAYVDQRFQKVTLTPSAGNPVLGAYSLFYNGNRLSGRIAINQSSGNVINFNVNPAPSWLTEILYGACFYSSTSSIGGVADICSYSLQASGILQLNLTETVASTHYIYFS